MSDRGVSFKNILSTKKILSIFSIQENEMQDDLGADHIQVDHHHQEKSTFLFQLLSWIKNFRPAGQ